MRLVVPEKQLSDLYHIFVLKGGEHEGGGTEDQSSTEMFTPERLFQELYRLWSEEPQWPDGGSSAILVSPRFLAELERLTDINMWKQSRIDVLICHKMFNIIDEILERATLILDQGPREVIKADGDVEMIDTTSKPASTTGGTDKKWAELLDQQLVKTLKFLKVSVIYASNIQSFSSLDRVVKLYNQYRQIGNLPMIEEILIVLITLSSRHNEKKILTGIATGQSGNKDGLDQFNTDIVPVVQTACGLIRNLDFIVDLMTAPDPNSLPCLDLIDDKLKSLCKASSKKSSSELSDNEVSQLILTNEEGLLTTIEDEKARAQFTELRRVRKLVAECSQIQKSAHQVIEEVFIQAIRYINLYLNVGDLTAMKDKFSQTNQLEQLLPPKLFVRKLIQVLNTFTLSKRVHIQALNVFFLFVILDLNQLFSYLQPQDNQYYVEACNHHELYNNLLQNLSRYHAYEKIKKMQEEKTSLLGDDECYVMIEQQRELIGGEEEMEIGTVSDSIKSQRFLNSFLNFLFHLLNFKNRQLQTQLYPQFLKPLLAIINVKPTINNVYPINISCQLKAAKLLKEVVKMSSLDDPGAVEKVIERLKDEIKNLQDTDTKWQKLPDDDCETDIINSYRQDMIRTYLRFLSYSIIKNDPNAINFTQNFVANSRKILDSGLVQITMHTYIFEANKTKSEAFLTQTIDPVILQCIQLISYLFNDLPQKIPSFIENDFFVSLLESLSFRIPVQPDLISLLMKLIQTLCLNSQGIELVTKSDILPAFARVSCDAQAHKLFVNPNKVMVFSEVIQAVLNQSKDLSLVFLRSLIKNFEVLIEKSWEVTR